MKFKNSDMDEAVTIMNSLHEQGKLGYAIARNSRKLKEEVKEYLSIKEDIFRKYGTQEEGGSTITVEKKDISKVNAELAEFADIEHDVDIYQVPEEVFTSGTLTSGQMECLLWMVDERIVSKE